MRFEAQHLRAMQGNARGGVGAVDLDDGQAPSTGHDAQRVTQAVRRIQGFKAFHRVPQAPTTQATTASQKGAVSTNTSVDTVMAEVVSASSTW